MDTRIIDLREDQLNPPRVKRKHRLRRGLVACRKASEVTGITLHQTAIEFGTRKHDLRRWPHDPQMALAMRSLDVACHVMAFRAGFIAVPNPLAWYVYHGNGLSGSDIGIEMEGFFPGLERNRRPDHTQLTPELVRASRAAVRFAMEDGRNQGHPIEYVHAHRQSSPSRRDDPGEALWDAVVVQYAEPVLGLKVQEGLILESTSKKAPGFGRGIPHIWSPTAIDEY